ncbi:MAG: hypothetical protein AAGF95_30035 [Chloroflexota bacterium]
MSFLSSLFAWYNLLFMVALGCSLLFALLQIVGGSGDSDTAADIDAGGDIDIDMDVDVDIDAGGDTSTASINQVGASSPLALLGIGRVPIMLLLTAFTGSLGGAGLILNTALTDASGNYPLWAFIPVLIISLVIATLLLYPFSRFFGRLAPDISTAVRYEQLVGRAGVVVSHTVSTTYGRVAVRDKFGSLHTVFAVVKDGEALPDQSEVALVRYDQSQRRFTVRALRR